MQYPKLQHSLLSALSMQYNIVSASLMINYLCQQSYYMSEMLMRTSLQSTFCTQLPTRAQSIDALAQISKANQIIKKQEMHGTEIA